MKIIEDSPITQNIEEDDFYNVMNLIEGALNPKVTFNNDFEQMQKEAIEVTEKNLRESKRILTKYVKF